MLLIIFCCISSYWPESCKFVSKSSCSSGTSNVTSPSAWRSSSIGYTWGPYGLFTQIWLMFFNISMHYSAVSTTVYISNLILVCISLAEMKSWEILPELIPSCCPPEISSPTSWACCAYGFGRVLPHLVAPHSSLVRPHGFRRVLRPVAHHSRLLMSLLDLVVLHLDQKP